MPTRVGIELSPTACRIVEIDARSTPGAHGPETVVRSFEQLPSDSAETDARFASLREQPVAVVAWGLRADHRQAVVTSGWYGGRRREAVAAAKRAGVETRRMLVDITPAPGPADDKGRRAVVVALAQAQDVVAALRPLRVAGVRVRSMVTPAVALMSMARLRRNLAASDLAEAYVALEEMATAVVLVRDGALVAARELEWGYQDERRNARPRDDIAERLGNEIERFLIANGTQPSALSQICVCGGLPELRSMTLPLMERLDVEVETLDSLFAINAGRLPEPAEEFRSRASDFRMAWAVAADWDAPINLLRERQRRSVKTVLTQAAVVAGVATGVGVGWQVQRTWVGLGKPASSPPVPAGGSPTGKSRVPAITLPPPPGVVAGVPAMPPSASVSSLTNSPAPPERPVANIPPVEKPPVAAAKPAPAPLVEPPAVDTVDVIKKSPSSNTRTASARTARGESPVPFDAVLGTILYGLDRKLAIVDGHIVQVGDDVHGARVIEITPTAVLLRDGRGQLRRLSFDARGR